MDPFKFHDVRVEKANAVAKYRKFQRITSFFRFIELLIFLIALSRCSIHVVKSFKLSGEYLRRVSLVSLLTPRSVFFVGNAIVVVLFFISGQFSGKKAEKSTDFYEEYVEKCRNNHEMQKRSEPEAKRVSRCCSNEVRVMSRTKSENLERVHAAEKRGGGGLRRSMSEKSGAAACSYAEDKMSSEEFRRTVEAFIRPVSWGVQVDHLAPIIFETALAFIARQQKSLREEEEDEAELFSAVVSLQP